MYWNIGIPQNSKHIAFLFCQRIAFNIYSRLLETVLQSIRNDSSLLKQSCQWWWCWLFLLSTKVFIKSSIPVLLVFSFRLYYLFVFRVEIQGEDSYYLIMWIAPFFGIIIMLGTKYLVWENEVFTWMTVLLTLILT